MFIGIPYFYVFKSGLASEIALRNEGHFRYFNFDKLTAYINQ